MTTTPPQYQPAPPGGFGIDPRLGAAALRALATSIHQPSSLDYRVRNKLSVSNSLDLNRYSSQSKIGLRYGCSLDDEKKSWCSKYCL